MSPVLKFCQPHNAKSNTYRSRQKLPDILANIAALLSRVQALEIQTKDDARQAIFLLELANGCIRLMVGQTPLNVTTRTTPLAQSARIDLLIAETRREATCLFEPTDLKSWIADDREQSKGTPRSIRTQAHHEHHGC
ncbi:hypothetical protein [Bradyrhizobium sp. Ghvi]|uniref:hypothetical protein n=1 Tax=Bradyrhizobium sp. Ghvi TaxID=1855319 RepID=UPI0015A639F3|nr:hypothetical protein [Bradyrhizobium sp. Ghvi]